MKDLLRLLNNRVVLGILLIAGVLVDLLLIGRASALTKAEWAAWVQAVGAIIGIGIAIWVPYHQKQLALAMEVSRSREEARRICLAIRDELKSLERMFTAGPNVKLLLALEPGEIFDYILPPVDPAERFRIYNSILGRLNLIDDDQLRQDIITAYEYAMGFIHAGMQNNRLLFEWRELEAILQEKFSVHYSNRQHFLVEELKRSAAGMLALFEETKRSVTNLLPKLDAAVY